MSQGQIESALFGNFSAMTMRFSLSTAGANQSSTVSFRDVGTSMVRGVQTKVANFTTFGSSQNSSALIYYDRNYSIVMVSYLGVNTTGTDARVISQGLISPFESLFTLNGLPLSRASLSSLHASGTAAQTFGNVTMQVTEYQLGSVSSPDGTVANVTASVGTISGTHLVVVVYDHAVAATNQGTVVTTLEVTSADPA